MLLASEEGQTHEEEHTQRHQSLASCCRSRSQSRACHRQSLPCHHGHHHGHTHYQNHTLHDPLFAFLSKSSSASFYSKIKLLGRPIIIAAANLEECHSYSIALRISDLRELEVSVLRQLQHCIRQATLYHWTSLSSTVTFPFRHRPRTSRHQGLSISTDEHLFIFAATRGSLWASQGLEHSHQSLYRHTASTGPRRDVRTSMPRTISFAQGRYSNIFTSFKERTSCPRTTTPSLPPITRYPTKK